MRHKITDILASDCEVVRLTDDQFIYPIFKNGRSSLIMYAEKNNLKILKNKDISGLKIITTFLRSPEERFASGVHTFCYITGQPLNKDILEKIERSDIVNKHFVSQYLWLFHLLKYFDGLIKIKPVDKLYQLIPNRDGPWTNNTKRWKAITQTEKKKILSIKHERYIDIDKKIIKKYMNKSVKLRKIIEEFKK